MIEPESQQEVADVDPASGLTEGELRCHSSLMDAYREFLDLPQQHPDELRDFVDAVHRIQDLMTIRIARREYPTYWATYDVGRVYDAGQLKPTLTDDQRRSMVSAVEEINRGVRES